MKTELTYLLEQLNTLDNNKLITVLDLKIMIEKSFNQAARDQQQIDDSINMST